MLSSHINGIIAMLPMEIQDVFIIVVVIVFVVSIMHTYSQSMSRNGGNHKTNLKVFEIYSLTTLFCFE